jgi:penicillin-binding protein 2
MALQHAITTSCNNYFCTTYKAIIEQFPTARQGMDAWSNHVKSFGMGKFLGSDLPTGRKGFVPDAAFYTRVYGGTSCRAVTTISNGIGQGELLVTPMQLANMTAAIANRGHWYIPHIVKKVGNQPVDNPDFFKKQRTTVHPKYFEVVINGMFDVFEIGTAAGSKVKHIQMCGKTGTAENPHGQDHSIFVAFAPKDNPKIALAMIVENGYWGARWAAPISSLMIEKYLTDSISRPDLERRMLEGNLQGEYGMSTKTKLPL